MNSTNRSPFAISVIQARMSSTRLPGKVLREMAGSPMLELMLERVRKDNDIPTIVATSTEPSDDPIEEVCTALDLPLVRGPLEDVLDRFIQAIDTYQPEVVVRLTGDNPFTDARAVQAGIEKFRAFYSDGDREEAGISNHLADRTDPHGYAVEVLKADRLRWLAQQELTADEKEHVTLGFINRNIYGSFHIIEGGEDMRWTVDYPEDFEYMSNLFEDLGRDATTAEALEWSGDHIHPKIEETRKIWAGK